MPALANSQRRIHKATYVNVRAADTDEDHRRRAMIGRPLEKLNFVRALRLGEAELSRLEPELEAGGAQPELVQLLRSLAQETSPTSNLRFAPDFAKVTPEALATAGRLIARSRRRAAEEARAARDELQAAYRGREVPGPAQPGTTVAPEPAAPQPQRTNAPAGLKPRATHRNAGIASPMFLGTQAEPTPAPAPARAVANGAPPRLGALAWGLENRVAAALRLDELARTVGEAVSVDALPGWYQTAGEQADDAVDAFSDLVRIEPIGRLHLERLEMTPVGLERGELAASIPLAPKETVSISHKEWSIRSEEFEQIVQDAFEDFSEEGVAEKNDLSQSTESQQKHATAFTLSGSYTYFSASATIGYSSTSEDQEAQKDSRQQSVAITRKASSRAKRDHKHSFKVSSVVGREEQSVRTLTNPSETEAMRVDYYQLMRRWRTDLYRYGLRMTYDIVIPSPGVDLMRKLDDIRVLDALIDKPFSIALEPGDIERDKWIDIAARYSAQVEPPPKATDELYRHHELTSRSEEEEAESALVEAVEFIVNDDYTVESGRLQAIFWSFEEGDPYFDVWGDPEGPVTSGSWYNSKLEHLRGRTGDLAVVFSHRGLASGTVQFTLALKLKDEAYRRWQYEAWTAIHDAAEQAYQVSRQVLAERRARLVEELAQWDALTLRRMEREEIMKGVLRWLFGPEFELVPADVQEFFEPLDAAATPRLAPAASALRVLDGTTMPAPDWEATDEPPSGGGRPTPPGEDGSPPIDVLVPSEENWHRVMQFGELIKFLHHAVEWENVLYFTYPYFWDSPANWDFKRFLRHPDPLHREFLRAGSARVVLTVRPGYEVDFARFVETGAMGDDHPYLTIAEEIQSYAQTHYPGIPPANPEDPENEDEVDQRERGELIGRWYEYTPTSALDIEIGSALDDMA
jgi:hypothetical protein